MHYVPGHEVASHIAQEVKNLAYSTTIPWNVVRKTKDSGSYSCQVGDIVATKLVGLFDCSPEVLTDCIINGWYETTPYSVLEEYDRNNQILLVKLQFAALQKQVRTCVYRYISFDKESQSHFVVFQSVDHDAVSDAEETITFSFAPTGFLVHPVPDNPNKCNLIYVSQLVDLEQQTGKEFVQAYCATAGSLGQLWEELTRLVAEYKRPYNSVSLLETVEEMRRELFSNFYELNSAKDWQAVTRTLFDVFMKEESPEYVSVAIRARSHSPEPCRVIAARVYEAIRNTSNWMWLIFGSEVVKEIDDGSCIVKISAQAIQTGLPSETLYLLSMRETIDGVCDVTWKSIQHEEFPLPPDRTRLEFSANGCIISPNGHGSTIQWLGRPPMVKKSSFSVVVRRASTFVNGALSYVNRPAEYFPVLDPQTGETLKQLPQNADNVTPLPPPPPSPMVDREEPKSNRKRKLATAPSLISVENIVVKIVPGEKPARPFLFLVSNRSEKRHRFVRRRWDSAISRSTFDLLPQELMEFVLSFLDASTLLYIVPCICSRFKELMEHNGLWKRLYHNQWGNVGGRLALRYCGDDEPTSFFSSNFPHWREMFWERQHIEQAWVDPERHAHGFRVAAGHTRDIRAVALLPTCHRLVTGSLDKLVRMWDAHSGMCLATLEGASGVVSICVSNPSQVKVGYKSGLVRLVDVGRSALEPVGEMRLPESMRGCAFKNNTVLTWDDEVDLWDETTQQCVRTFNEHTGFITSCVFSPSNSSSLVFSASRDKTVKIWDTNSGARIANIVGHTRGVNGLAVLQDHLVASVSSDKSMRVWDTRNLSAPLYLRFAPNGKIKCVQFTETGNKICAGGTDGVHIWETKYNFEKVRWDQTEQVRSIAVDEERLVCGAVGGVIRFYSFAPHK